MSLTTCIRKAGTALRAEDKNAILARTRELMKAGQSAQQAAEQAVDAQIATVRALLSKYADPNYQPAPAAPQAAPTTTTEQTHGSNEGQEGQGRQGQGLLNEPAGVHQDPGQPAEPATKLVVDDALKTAAKQEARPLAEMKADLLAQIDAAIAKAPSTEDIDADITIGKTITSNSRKEMEARRQFGDDTVDVLARETADEKWSVSVRRWVKNKYEYTRIGEVYGTPAPARAELMTLMRRLQADGTLGDAGMVTFDVPGDGKFKVLNFKDRLQEFRRKVETSLGFKNAKRPDTPHTNNAGQPTGVETGSGSTKTAIENMIDDGDYQAAVDFAAAKKVDIREVLKDQKSRLAQIAGLTPTEAAAEPAPAEPARPHGVPEKFIVIRRGHRHGDESIIGVFDTKAEAVDGAKDELGALIFDGRTGQALDGKGRKQTSRDALGRSIEYAFKTGEYTESARLIGMDDPDVATHEWQKTVADKRQEFRKSDDDFTAFDNDQHRVAVEIAVSLGKPVPAGVLADYPDLATSLTEAAAPAPEAEQPTAQEPAQAAPAKIEDLGEKIGGARKDMEAPSERKAEPMPHVVGIPADVAQRAYEHTSHVPEDRGRQAQARFTNELQDAWDQAMRVARGDEAAVARVREVFDDLVDGYRRRVIDYLGSHSRVASAMIVGPARFPAERMRKRSEAADRKAQEADEYLKRGIKRMQKAARGPIDNSPEAELERVRYNLARREELQEQMKAANVALRKGDDDALSDLGFSDGEIAQLKKGDFAGRKGFPDYKLSNNNAEIRRLRGALKEAEARAEAAQAGPQESERAGVRIVEDAQDDRLRLIFDGKPSEAIREDLKANGFKWSPRNEAWQRQLTGNARAAAKRILDKHFPTKTDDAGNVVMFSRAQNFGDKVDAVLAGGVPDDAAVPVSEPLPVLETLGMPALPVQTTAARLNKMHFDHGLTAADLKALPSLLEQPVMVFESVTQPGSKVLVLDLWRRGMPVLAAVHPNVKLKRLDVNLLASAYPKDRPEQLGNWFKNGLLRYADKEKTRAWATNGGVQFPWLVQLQRGSAKSVLGPSDVGKPAARRTDTPATSSSAQQLADHLSDVWANAPRVVVVDSMADSRVPQVARDELARQDEGTPTDGKTTAFYYNDTVYLIGEQSEREALTSLFHEVLGHHGLRHVFGGALRTILDRIAQLNPGLVRERAIAYGLGRWVDDGDGKRFQYGRFDKEGRFLGGEQVARQTAAEELLARMAQTRPQLGWVKRALAAIRTWLRKHVPGFGAMKFSDAELIRSFILPARAWVERGASEKAPQTSDAPAFARTDTDAFKRERSAPSGAAAGGVEAGSHQSPIGNRGTFDPNNPDVRFSRVSDAIDTLKSATTEKGLRDILSDHLTSDKTFNWWHNTIGTQYQKAKADPTHFGPVYEAAQDYLHDTSAFANDAAALAPDVVPQLKGWRDAFKPLRLSDADEQALASAIFTGTLQDQKVYTPDELRAQFNATDRQIALYQQMRAAIDRSLDQLVASDVARYLGQDIPKAIKDMISDGDTGRFKGLVTDLAQKKKAEADAALTEVRKANRKRLSDMHRAHKKRREAAKGPMARSNLEDVLATERAEVVAETKAREDAAKATYDKWNEFERTIKAKYERVDQLKQEGYAPLMRFGRYTVDVVSDEGERQFFGLYESEPDAKKAAREFRESGEFKGSTITTGLLSQEAYKQFSSMAPETIELFAEVAGVEQTPLFQEYLRRAKSNRAAIKRLIQRKGIAGFSEDAQRVLAAFLTSNARAASTNLHMGDMGRLIEAIPKEKGDVKDEAIRLKEYVQNPTEEAQRLRGLLFVQYLGGSIASALVNMTQPLTMTLPYLSQFGGLGKAGARLAEAMKSAMHKQTGALGAALAKAEKEGIVSPQEVHQLHAEASRSLGSNPTWRRVLFAWGSMFSLAEQFNRRVSFIAAWNTAKANGNPNPYQFAVDAVEQTQGVYNRGNRPNWARGPVGATVFTFKQFSISYLEFLKRLPPKERVIALAVLVLAAGAQGLPFADDLDDLIDTIGQHLGYDTNAKLWKTKVLTKAFGEMGADFALHGFSALPGFPLDVSWRLAVSNLIPGTGILRKNTSDKSSDVFEAIGPAGGVVRDATRGDVWPLAIRNLRKSIEMYQTGEYRDTRDRKVMDVTGLDALVKGIGFQPAEVARESRGIQMRNQQVQLARNVEAEIASLWAQGIADKEPDKVREARQRLADWNRDNPQSRIGITTGQLERRVREMRKPRQQRFEKAMPKEMRGTV